jgi:hypothetical protein
MPYTHIFPVVTVVLRTNRSMYDLTALEGRSQCSSTTSASSTSSSSSSSSSSSTTTTATTATANSSKSKSKSKPVASMRWSNDKQSVLFKSYNAANGFELRSARRLWSDDVLILQQTARRLKTGESASAVTIFKRAKLSALQQQQQQQKQKQKSTCAPPAMHVDV